MPGRFNESMKDSVFYIEDEMKGLFVRNVTPQFRKMALKIQKVNKNDTGSTSVAEAKFIFDEMLETINELIHRTILGIKQNGFMEVEMQENIGKIVRQYTEYARKIARIYVCNAFPYMDAHGDAAGEMSIEVSEFENIKEDEIVFDGNDISLISDYFDIIYKHKKVAERFTRELVVRSLSIIEPTAEDIQNVKNDVPTCTRGPIPMLLKSVMYEDDGEAILSKALNKYFSLKNESNWN